MWHGVLKLVFKLHCLMAIEEGQNLMEYSLLAFLIACGTVAGVGQLASAIGTAYNNIAQEFANAVSAIGA
jgi:Flp pilus assembly pilin Flp